MHFAVAREHLEFFHTNRFIEFENLLTDKEIQDLEAHLKTVMGKRLHTAPEHLSHVDLQTFYLQGYDTWREDPEIKKYALKPQLATLASNLTKVCPIRIGFDQVFRFCSNTSPFFETPSTLNQLSCIQGLVCGCILNISSPSTVPENTTLPFTPISRKAGSGIFFRPDLPLSLDSLFSTPNSMQLLITYAHDRSLYTYQQTDLHTHTLKNLDYVFGDRLKDSSHPILYRG